MSTLITKRANIIAYAISNNSTIARDALIMLNQNQTPIERAAGKTLDYNLIGVDGLDSRKLIPLLDRIECARFNGVTDDLSGSETRYIQTTLQKYCKQIALIEAMGGAFPYDMPEPATAGKDIV